MLSAIEKWESLSSSCINDSPLVYILDQALNDIVNVLSPEEIIDNIFSPLKELDRMEIEFSKYLTSSKDKCAPLLLPFIASQLNYPLLIDAVFDRGMEGILYHLDRRPSLRGEFFDQNIFLQIMEGIYETQTEVILDLERWLRWITIADYYFYIYYSYVDALLCWKKDFPKLGEGMCKVDLVLDTPLLNFLMGDTMNCFLSGEREKSIL